MLLPFRKKSNPDDIRNIILTTLRCRHVTVNLAASASYFETLADRIAAEAPLFESPRDKIEWLVARIEREQFSLWEDAMDGSAEAFVA